MVLVVVFGAALLMAVLLSGLAARTVLSTCTHFLVGGVLVSDGFLGLIHITPDSEIVSVTADLALFAVLFTDGMHVSLSKLRANWRNSARALGLGMPLAFVFRARATHYLVGLDWTTSFLVGAALAPTDPVFASAIVGRAEVPAKLRQLLKVETSIILCATCHLAHANPYLAAFSAGAVLAHTSPEAKASFELLGTRISRKERLVAARFGPKGFASVVYGLLVLQSGIPQGEEAFTLVAVCIAFSIIAHSSTDMPIARAFDIEDLAGIPDGPDGDGTGRKAPQPRGGTGET
jgi:NhaP-type Na+/H+ or K+/H+ antiporter